MRIVMLSKALVAGAYQRKLEELACLPGVDLTLIVPASWRDRRGETRLERAFTRGYRLLVAPLAFNGQYHLHWYPTLGRMLRSLRPEVLHVDEEPYNLATWQALRLGRACGARGLFFTWQNLPRRYPLPFSYFERASYMLAFHAIAGNQAASQVLRAKGFVGPISVVPQFGVDPEIFRPGQAAVRREVGAELTIGYAGALIPEKGVDLLLRACARLQFAGWALEILGDGPERRRLEALGRELGLGGRVRFWGRVPSTEAPDYYRRFDLLVLPSVSRPNWIEQFGRVLVEAMASGVAVIGSSSGEIPQVIGEAGLLFPEGDVEALCHAITELAGDVSRRADLARRGRQRVLQRFTQRQVAAATYDIYQQMLSGAC